MMAVEDYNVDLLKIVKWKLQIVDEKYGRSVVNMIGWSSTLCPGEIRISTGTPRQSGKQQCSGNR